MKLPKHIIAKAERANRLACEVERLNIEIEEWMESRCDIDCASDELRDRHIYESHGETVDVEALRKFVEEL